MRILLVEDDEILGEAVRDHVIAAGHAVDWFGTIADAQATARVTAYGLILLDLRLPDGSGLRLLKQLRGREDATPVIILTAHDQISDRIEGLNSGADDYLVKPFDLDELSARIHAVARRYQGKPASVVRLPGITVDQANRHLTVDGDAVSLSGREWAVLERLLERPGAIVSKVQIEEALYAFGSEIESNTVEVYVSRLRKKIGKERIGTVRGLGYSLEAKA
uniref:DNA-binding response OmpR family regulator n=1 Tax=Pararhizobium capsulatum DSM 1112 TaxID=1121113 RepID=A0ABU0BIT9_9HYPH|nr:response regulator transcription factor [Pararhizobium capsulatum]MDQ0318175.1 DNA-binding response OmpR family regulator [Pararhizobium capsulatum DSM 1112]